MAEDETPEEKENWWEHCPICGSKLINQRCKLVCSDDRCYYFQSCSEFDT